MRFYVNIMGDKVMEHKLRRMGSAPMRARSAMRKVALLLMEIEGAIFQGQGRRGGGSWQADTEEWVARKVSSGLDPRLNIATGTLMRSMSEPEAPHQDLLVGDSRVLLGSDLPYAGRVNKARPFTRLLETDKLKIRAIVEAHILEKFYSA